MYWLKQNKLFFLLLVIVACLPAVFALLMPGFFVTDDGDWMVIRFSAFYEAFRDGQIPVRFLERLNHGYGYPVANFLYPGFMYLAVPIKAIGFNFIWSIKLLLTLSMIGSGVFSYLWLRKLFDKFSSVIGALVFVYAPYHLYDLYVRGSVGEILAFAFVPFILWQFERRSVLFSSLGIFFLILSHNSLALLFLPLLFLYALCTRTFSLLNTMLIFFFGVLLTSFFTVPAIIELGFTRFSEVSISNPRDYFASINLIGFIVIGIVCASFALYIWTTVKRNKIYPRLFTLMTIILILSVFFSSKLGGFVWNYIPSGYIQFPFRILSLSILASAFLAGYILNHFQGTRKKIFAIGIVLLLVLSSFQYIFPKERTYFEDTYYSTNEGTTTVQNEYMPIWVQQEPSERPFEKVEVESGNILITNIQASSRKISFDASSINGGSVLIHTIYYPGWNAYVNSSRTVVEYDNPRGIMKVDVPQGDSKVEVIFEENVLRLFSDMMTLATLVFLLLYSSGTSIRVKEIFRL